MVFGTTFGGPWVSTYVFSGVADLYDMLYIMVRLDVLHFCRISSFRLILEIKRVPFRLEMEDILGDFGLLLGALGGVIIFWAIGGRPEDAWVV